MESTSTASTPAFRSTTTSCPDFSVSVAPVGEKEPIDSTSLSGTSVTSRPSRNLSTFILSGLLVSGYLAVCKP